MAADGRLAPEPPEDIAARLDEACALAVEFYPPSREVLSSCTLVGLPFSIYVGRSRRICTYFYQVALWLERNGRLYEVGEPVGDDLACYYAPLILIRDECLSRATPAMVATSLVHEVEHLRRYPDYTRQVLALVKEGMGRDEAIPIVQEREEELVHELIARLSAEDEEFRGACIDAGLIEISIGLHDELAGRLAPWGAFKYAMTFYVLAHRPSFRIHECFCELRELLMLDAKRKSEALALMTEEARRAEERRRQMLARAGEELEVSWVFRWEPKGR